MPEMRDVLHTSEEPDELHVKYRVFREPMEAKEHPAPVEARWADDRVTHGRQGPESYTMYYELDEVDSFTFVLKPDTDHHARVALAAYAASVRPFKPRLAEDLLGVLEMAEWDEENGKAW